MTAAATSTVAAETAPRVDTRPTRDHRRVEEALRVVDRGVGSGTLPSAVVGVSDSRGTMAVHAVSGPGERPVSPESIFFLASVTKPLVATAVMQLVDEGRLDLHVPITRYVPAFAGPGHERVTAWHVLTHTSGLTDVPVETLRRERPSYAKLLAKVCHEPLSFEPGSRYRYASDPWYLLSEAIVALTGMPFAEALRRRLTGPLGMTETTFDPRSHRRRIAPVHGVPLGNVVIRELVLRFLARATPPGGGLFSTLGDLLRFGRAFLPSSTDGGGSRVLSRAAIDEMTRDHVAGVLEVHEDGTTRQPHYGLGWGKPHPEGTVPRVVDPLTLQAFDGRPVADGDLAGDDASVPIRVPASPGSFTHGGASGTRIWVDPERDLVFCFLTNRWGASDEPMFATLAEVYRAWDSA